jgi:hypothetical protein
MAEFPAPAEGIVLTVVRGPQRAVPLVVRFRGMR